MTKDEIEERKEILRNETSVPDILARYGVRMKWNRCRGFCHDGKDFNMKVFRNGCHCFVCGKSMDIFDITMHFENCDFWTAFEILGGTEKPSWRATVTANRSRRQRLEIEQERRENAFELHKARMYLSAYQNLLSRSEPLSKDWIYYYNKLQYQEYLYETLLELGE